ncbi:hypothetical protein DFH09DRAFT_1095708 [Mycena vulgaris]|nr:hypothetical protein DFH09DRAFT_1095708 [Mycena vulgaris]
MEAIKTRSFLQKHKLQAICFTLHIILVLGHVVLLIGGVKHWDHSFTFPVEQQTAVSFWTTTITQTFGTIYSSILVFLTQKLAMQQNLQTYQTLTATHDSIASWSGLGSALATLYNQVSVPASVFGTLNIAGYLTCVSILHITIPAMLSAETFSATFPLTANTFGVPEFENSTTVNSTTAFMTTYPTNFLPWRGIFDNSQMLGLFNGSLYEVLQNTTNGKGQARVSATGFKITCGYVPAVLDQVSSDVGSLTWNFTFNGLGAVSMYIYLLGSGLNTLSVIQRPFSEFVIQPNNSIVIYTTNMVVDSDGNQGSPVFLNSQPTSILQTVTDANLSITQFQFLQCSKTLVSQSGTIDAQSNTLSSSLHPIIYKNYSHWIASMDMNFTSEDSTLLGSDLWSDIISRDRTGGIGNVNEYLMTYLGLDPLDNTSLVLQLHDIENALSSLVAMTFWIDIYVLPGGNIQLDSLVTQNSFLDFTSRESGTIPVLASNHTVIQQEIPRVRLNILIGLAISTIQVILCFKFLSATDYEEPTKGVGLLEYIWLWHRQQELSHLMKDVQEPIGIHLRIAGLTPFRIYTKRLEDTKAESFAAKVKGQQSIGLVLAQIFGTIYYPVLVFLTQKQAITAVIQQYSILTVTHDKVSAWTGIGSAVSTLYKQWELPVSFLGTISICLYLSSISILHITTSALFSVETFNSILTSTVETQSIPEWSDPSHNSTIGFMQSSGAFLPWMGALDDSKMIGLYNGSLYDVLTLPLPGNGTTQVSAIGFNITCGYIPAEFVGTELDGLLLNISFPMEDTYKLVYNYSGVNSILMRKVANMIILFTQNTVIDSGGNKGFPLILDSSLSLQFIGCVKSLTSQIAQVHLNSRAIIPGSLEPTTYKNHSKWYEYGTLPRATNGTALLEDNTWAQVVVITPGSYVPNGEDPDSSNGLSSGELYNQTCGHIHPTPVTLEGTILDDDTVTLAAGEIINPPILSTGSATVEDVVSAARLDPKPQMNLWAASIGLGVSLLLLSLAVMFSIETTSNSPLSGLGFLQIVWLLQHHPDLSDIIEQIENPTDYNLRVAGLVKHPNFIDRSAQVNRDYFLVFLINLLPDRSKLDDRMNEKSMPLTKFVRLFGVPIGTKRLAHQQTWCCSGVVGGTLSAALHSAV